MHWIVVLCVLALFIDALLRAIRGGKAGPWRWVWTLLGGILFGLIVEHFNSSGSGTHSYCYPPAPFPFNVWGVPIWVPIGWGGIIYAAAWTAQRLRLGFVQRAVATAFLVASIDFSLDPVAKMLGFWVWECDTVNFFGVPYDNFNGWYLIVFVYALSANFVLGRTRKYWSANSALHKPTAGFLLQLLLPLLCAGLATLLLLFVLKPLVPTVTGWITAIVVAIVHPTAPLDPSVASAVLFMILTALGAGTIIFSTPRASQPVKRNWPVILVPAIIHLSSYVLFLVNGGMMMKEECSLVATIPLQLLAGLFVYTAPWRR
jgi:uncharacterized membrane protein